MDLIKDNIQIFKCSNIQIYFIYFMMTMWTLGHREKPETCNVIDILTKFNQEFGKLLI